MVLTCGTKLGPYEIQSPLGVGGMGEVYRATDSKLGRDVALKVIPQEFAQDAQLMARFQREAQVLASLNHANIASIYGLEEKGGVRALVMELVKGPTLAERIMEGAIPIEEALPIAKQIAEALEYAHERGIIHRDLKPANIKLTHDGKVKVLDFGLAKALQDDVAQVDPSASPTLSMAATKAGIILGTAGYMSPEQAKGKPVDSGDARLDLDDALNAPPDAASMPSPNPLWRSLPWALAAVAIVIAAWTLWNRTGIDMASREVMHLDITYPPNVEPVSGVQSGFAVSPDGRTVAMFGIRDGLRRLYIRRLDRPEATEINTFGANSVAFSPDSTSMAFNSASGVTRLSLADQKPAILASGADWGSSVAWAQPILSIPAAARFGLCRRRLARPAS